MRLTKRRAAFAALVVVALTLCVWLLLSNGVPKSSLDPGFPRSDPSEAPPVVLGPRLAGSPSRGHEASLPESEPVPSSEKTAVLVLRAACPPRHGSTQSNVRVRLVREDKTTLLVLFRRRSGAGAVVERSEEKERPTAQSVAEGCDAGEHCARVDGLLPGGYRMHATEDEGGVKSVSRVLSATLVAGMNIVKVELESVLPWDAVVVSVRSGKTPISGAEVGLTLEGIDLGPGGTGADGTCSFGPLGPGQEIEARVTAVWGMGPESLPEPQRAKVRAHDKTRFVFQIRHPPWHRVVLRPVREDTAAPVVAALRLWRAAGADFVFPPQHLLQSEQQGTVHRGALPPGSYGVRVTGAPGLAPAWRTFTVGPGADTDIAIPLSSTGETIRFLVTTAHGTPARHAWLLLRRARPSSPSETLYDISVSTNADGRTGTTILPSGTYGVQVHDRWYRTVEVVRSEEIALVLPSDPPSASKTTIEGRVFLSDGTMAAGAYVHAGLVGSEWGQCATTNREGAFVFRDLPGGAIEIAIEPSFFEKPWPPFAQRYTLGSDERKQIEIRLVPR